MSTATQIDNYQDTIDSRNIIEAIEDLEGDTDVGAIEQLRVLTALADEASSSPDWEYGETLIRDSYFKEYAQELADDCGMVPDDAKWPLTHIDWDAAADELKQDYFSVDFSGVEYWIRA